MNSWLEIERDYPQIKRIKADYGAGRGIPYGQKARAL
jgi:hypothetical protein